VIWPNDYIYPKKIDGEWKRVTNSTPWKPPYTGSAHTQPTPIPDGFVSHAIPMVLGFNWPLLESLYQKGKGPKILDWGREARGKFLRLPCDQAVDEESLFEGLSSLVTRERNDWTKDWFWTRGRFESPLGFCPENLVYSSFIGSKQVEKAKKVGRTNRTELRIELVVTNVARSESLPLEMLDFPETVKVVDNRFSLRNKDWIPTLGYLSTNGSIPTVERVMAQEFYRNAVALHAASERGSLRRRVLLGFLILAGPLLVWWISGKQKEKGASKG